MQRVSNFLYRYPWLFILLLLAAPMGWMLFIYLGSLGALLINSFFRLDDFTGVFVREFALGTYA